MRLLNVSAENSQMQNVNIIVEREIFMLISRMVNLSSLYFQQNVFESGVCAFLIKINVKARQLSCSSMFSSIFTHAYFSFLCFYFYFSGKFRDSLIHRHRTNFPNVIEISPYDCAAGFCFSCDYRLYTHTHICKCTEWRRTKTASRNSHFV